MTTKNYINHAPFMFTRWWMTIEFGFLYLSIPIILIYTEDIFPLISTLIVIVLVVLLFSYFNNRRLYYPEVFDFSTWNEWRKMLLTFLFFGSIMTLAAWFFVPEYFFSFPQEAPLFWLLVMILYPLLSAFPQELIFRLYFFRRYPTFFKMSDNARIIFNAALFAYAHIMFMHWFTIVATFFGSLLFSKRYMRTRSIPLVLAEHALYGNLFFTVGFGQFFYSGVV